jgi:hypothetical protein
MVVRLIQIFAELQIYTKASKASLIASMVPNDERPGLKPAVLCVVGECKQHHVGGVETYPKTILIPDIVLL